MTDLVLTPEMKAAVSAAYDEWQEYQVEITSAKECQKDIVDALAEKFELSKADINWIFRTRFGNKIDDQAEKFENKQELYTSIFG